MTWLQQLLLLCPLLFIAGIIDGVSGGGGLIALPAYLLAGLPVSSAYGCNKMQSCLGTSASMAKYIQSGLFDLKAALPAAGTAMIGAWCATQVMLKLSDPTKKLIIIAATCFVIGIMLLSGRMKVENYTLRHIAFSQKNIIMSMGIGLLLGLYDGFFGPGGGTVAILLFAIFMKYDLRVGCGNGKFIIVVSNFISMVTYMVHGNVIYKIALPCSACNILGSYLGASLATKKGANFVKYVSWVVAGMLLIYTVWELILG